MIPDPKLEAVLKALRELHADQSVGLHATRDAIKMVIDEAEILLDAVKVDIRKQVEAIK